MPDVKRSGIVRQAPQPAPRNARSPLSRWIADALSIETLSPSKGADRLRDLHLGRLTAELIDGKDDVEVLRSARDLLTEPRPAIITFQRPCGGECDDATGAAPLDRIDVRVSALERARANPAGRADAYVLGGAVPATPATTVPRWRPPLGWSHVRNPFSCPPRRTRRDDRGGDGD